MCQGNGEPLRSFCRRHSVTVGHVQGKYHLLALCFKMGWYDKLPSYRREMLLKGCCSRGVGNTMHSNAAGCSQRYEKVKKLLKCALRQSPSYSDKENEPPKKKIKLSISNSDLDTFNSGEKLSDIPINLTQQLLKNQFPSVNGLQSTLLQSKPRTGESPDNQLQIIHSRGDHWIVASTIGCTDTVCVYDSVYNTLDKGNIDIILNLFHSSVMMMECQKQVGGKDCGVFAIGNATAISHGVDRTCMEINQATMWNHLSKCLKEEKAHFISMRIKTKNYNVYKLVPV